jgi:hypothetical protein
MASILYLAGLVKLLLGLSFLEEIDFWGGDFDSEAVLFDCLDTLAFAMVCFILSF